MPGDPYSRSCTVAGCGQPVTFRGRCRAHADQVEASRGLGSDRYRGAALYRSSRWARLRASVLRRSPVCTCARCVADGRVRPTSVVHHRAPHGGDPARFFDVGNLVAMAASCHNALTATQGRGIQKLGAGHSSLPLSGAARMRPGSEDRPR
jgi:5-methylcytosine-specific restriction endonuclease McrA